MQTSSKPLSATQEQLITQKLYTLLADLRQPKEIKAFLEDFLTVTERSVFAKRLSIAWLLNQGKSYEDIKRTLNVSSATISAVAELKNRSGLKKALEKLKLDDWADRWSEKINTLLGKKG